MIPELRTFIAVARVGTFAGAGERIGLTQSAVSGQIKRLEDSLGFALFDRTGRSAALNAEGLKTLARAEELVRLFAKLGEPQEEAPTPAVLRIGAISSIQLRLLVSAMIRFRQALPKQRVRVVPGSSLYLLDRLDAGEIDTAIMVRPPFAITPELRWHTLVREPFVLAVHKLTKGRDWRTLIEREPFLRYDRQSFAGRQVERFLQSEGLSVRDAVELDEVPSMLEMVANGLGVALVPDAEAYRPLLAQTRVIRLGERTFSRDIGMLRRNAALTDPAVTHLMDCIVGASNAKGDADARLKRVRRASPTSAF